MKMNSNILLFYCVLEVLFTLYYLHGMCTTRRYRRDNILNNSNIIYFKD